MTFYYIPLRATVDFYTEWGSKPSIRQYGYTINFYKIVKNTEVNVQCLLVKLSKLYRNDFLLTKNFLCLFVLPVFAR